MIFSFDPGYTLFKGIVHGANTKKSSQAPVLVRNTDSQPVDPAMSLRRMGLAWKMLRAIVLNQRAPLMVVWNVTYRCNLKCKYCGVPQLTTSDECSQIQALELVDQMATAGVCHVTLSGGEPLLRQDLPAIIACCRAHGMSVSVKSNGLLVAEDPSLLTGVNDIQFSLDGRAEVHDRIRGKGSYDRVMEAILACKKIKLPVSLSTVITRYNLDQLGHVLEIADRSGAVVYFQPADTSLSAGKNNLDDIVPRPKDYQRAIQQLMEWKQKGKTCIGNSMAGLRHLALWPESTDLRCMASLVCAHVEPDGRLFVCDMFPDYRNHLQPANTDFKAAFAALQLPHSCHHCWSGSTVELNLLGKFNVGAAISLWRRSRNLQQR